MLVYIVVVVVARHTCVANHRFVPRDAQAPCSLGAAALGAVAVAVDFAGNILGKACCIAALALGPPPPPPSVGHDDCVGGKGGGTPDAGVCRIWRDANDGERGPMAWRLQSEEGEDAVTTIVAPEWGVTAAGRCCTHDPPPPAGVPWFSSY